MSDDPKRQNNEPGKSQKKLSEDRATGSKKVEKRGGAGFALDGGDIRKPKPTVQSTDGDK